MNTRFQKWLFLILLSIVTSAAFAQDSPPKELRKAPDRFRGNGPHSQLIIRGVTLINAQCSSFLSGNL